MRNTSASNFFPMPNEIFGLGLSAGEIAVYADLMFCEDRKTYTCHPSYKTIGKALHISSNTVKKYIRQLESKSLITAKQTRILVNGRYRNGNLMYTILPIVAASDEYFKRQLAANSRRSGRVEFKAG